MHQESTVDPDKTDAVDKTDGDDKADNVENDSMNDSDDNNVNDRSTETITANDFVIERPESDAEQEPVPILLNFLFVADAVTK